MREVNSKFSCSVFVPSYDPYSDLWTPYFHLFFKYWKECPFPVYLGANKLSFDHPRVQMLHTQKGPNWTDGMLDMLQHINSEYIILWLEDFFLQAPVNQDDIDYCIGFLEKTGGHYLRLRALPGPDTRIEGEKKIGLIGAGHPYRVSMQTSIWRKSSLVALLKAGESIWQFEVFGSKRSSELFPDGFFGSWKDVTPYKHHVVERGKWFPWEARKFRKMDIGCDFTRRKIMNTKETMRWYRDRYLGIVFSFLAAQKRKLTGNKR